MESGLETIQWGKQLKKENNMMSIKPCRLECIGAGQIFNEAHLAAYVSLESLELAAIYARFGVS